MNADMGMVEDPGPDGNRCAQMGTRPSMGGVGDADENAMAESFFARLEWGLVDCRV